ncbi:MAG: hypothetical protein PV347_00475 [Rickettsiaceae bacterium]|nr:hypothetical protein [Rickettsiaceae bacterium]
MSSHLQFTQRFIGYVNIKEVAVYLYNNKMQKYSSFIKIDKKSLVIIYILV